jgi:hypothetical protein
MFRPFTRISVAALVLSPTVFPRASAQNNLRVGSITERGPAFPDVPRMAPFAERGYGCQDVLEELDGKLAG